MRYTSIAILIVAITAGCGKKKDKDTSSTSQTYFTHGDPTQLVSGATMNTQSLFTTSNVSTYKNYVLAARYSFFEKSETSNNTSAEQGQEANTGGSSTSAYWSFQDEGSSYLYKPSTVVDGEDFALQFSVSGSQLSLNAICTGNNYSTCTSVTVLHYSKRTDGRAISFLVSYTDATYGKALVGIFFSLPGSGSATQVDTKYKYLAGPGIVTKWKETLAVHICGSPGTDRVTDYTTGVNSWLKSGKLGAQLGVTLDSTTTIKPFTDLETHCITTIDNFLIENQANESVMGITLPVMDLVNAELLGGHVLIMRTSSEKVVAANGNDETFRSALFKLTSAHEFGHLIGLDHEFAKDSAGKQLYQSIMSYDTETNIQNPVPQTHDKESIANAYGSP